jgi:multidrug efflux pump subunit AcrA (membrane-fusion protein)
MDTPTPQRPSRRLRPPRLPRGRSGGGRHLRRPGRGPSASASAPPGGQDRVRVGRRWSRARVGRRALAGGGAAAAVVLVGGAVLARGEDTSGYRTATVADRSVDQTLERVGTVEPVAQATVSFPVAGTVATVDVAVGDTVDVGQALASLDTGELDAQLVEAQAALDQAELNLERARNGESPNGDSGSSPGGSDGDRSSDGDGMSDDAATFAQTSTGSAGSAGSPGRATEVTDDQIAAAQQAVLDAQAQVDTAIAASQQALDDAATVCAAVGGDPSTTTTTTAPPADGTSSSSSSTPTTADPGPIDACQAALATVQEAQTQVADAQGVLNDAVSAYDDLLAQWAAELAEDDASGGPDRPGGDDGGAGGNGGQDGGDAAGGALPGGDRGGTEPSGSEAGPSGGADTSGDSSYPSAEELIALQKEVDAAAADVAVAEQAVDQARVVSPLAGTVQAVTLAVGDGVSAGDTTTAVVVAGDGGYEVSTTVTVDQLADVEVGQAVEVTPDGSDEALSGEVTSIGVVGTGSGSSTSYPVVVSLTEQPGDGDATAADSDGDQPDDADDPGELRNGATASLVIVTATGGESLAVPTSAVTVDGDRASVTVLEGGEPTEVDVEVGAMGDTRTEIVGGLDEGQQVVLADLDEPLPGEATDSDASSGPGGFDRGGPGGPEVVRIPTGAGPPGGG